MGKFIPHNTFNASLQEILGSIVVSIPACHAGDRGSIPRRGGNNFHFLIFFFFNITFSFHNIYNQAFETIIASLRECTYKNHLLLQIGRNFKEFFK